MGKFNVWDYEGILDAIQLIVRNEISKNNAKMELHYDGIVKTVSEDNKSATVDLGFMDSDELKNRTGETLSVGDTVRVYAASNTLIDAYIGVKMN